MEQQKKIISIADLPQVRVLGRTTGKDVINLFWTGSGIEFYILAVNCGWK